MTNDKNPMTNAPSPLRVVLYARVSTDMQAEEGHSIDAQLHEMREFVALRGWQIIGELIDPGASGSSMNRPGLQALLQAVENKETDVILVHETSRLSRSIFDTFRIFEILGQHDVGFASVKDPNFDFSTPSGRFFLTMISAMNQYYLDLLKQHTAKGKRERARKGLYNASTLPYGYAPTKDPQSPPVINRREAEGVRLAFETYAAGNASYQQVAERLNEAGYRTRSGRRFAKDTVDDMLRNPFYIGKIIYGTKRKDKAPETFAGQHEKIISPQLFEACREARRRRRGNLRSYQPKFETYLLNGISVCSLCDRSLRAQKTKTGRYYREMSRTRGFTDCPNAQKGVHAGLMEAQIEAIVRHLSLPEDWQEEIETILSRESEVEALNNRRARLKAKKRRLGELYADGFFDDAPENFKEQLAQVQRELDIIPSTDLEAILEAADTLTYIGQVWEEATMEEKRDIIRLLFSRVEIDVQQNRIAALRPYAVFLPLFRQSKHLLEVETGRFIPLWSPELAEQESPDEHLPALKKPTPAPEQSIIWPQIIALPKLSAHRRISPLLSRFLRERRKSGRPIGRLVDVPHPGYQALRLDGRKWAGLSLSRLPANPPFDLPDRSVSFLHTPFIWQETPHRPAWLAEAARLLDAGGWWVMMERIPVSMPGNWLYRCFPELLAQESVLSQTPSEIYVALQEQGFTVKMAQQTYYQPVQYGAALEMARQREQSPVLLKLNERDYLSGLERLKKEAEVYGNDALLASQVCVAEIVAQRMG